MQNSESTSRLPALTLRQAALTAGLAYVFNPVTFDEGYAMPRLVAANPMQTVSNLTAHPHLFAAAILSYVFSALGDIVIAWSLYVLLSPVHRPLALLGSLFQLVYAGVWLSAIANLGTLYRFTLIPTYAQHIAASALPSLAEQSFAAYRSAWGLSLILFGLHLVVTGWLMARSTYLPRWLGWLLFLDGWAWVADNLSVYLYPTANLTPLNAIFAVELVFMVWLLGWGSRLPQPQPA